METNADTWFETYTHTPGVVSVGPRRVSGLSGGRRGGGRGVSEPAPVRIGKPFLK